MGFRLFLLPFLLCPLPAREGPRWTWGFEERVRHEAYDNLSDHTKARPDERVQQRFRTRLWGTWQGKNWSICAGLCGENRRIQEPEGLPYNGREGLVESLYLDGHFSGGWRLRLGRQDLLKGEGFIVWDGTPGDGSRSQFFDALVLARTSGNHRLEALAIDNQIRDRRLPVLNEIRDPKEYNRLVEWRERAFGLYYTGSFAHGCQAEAYALLKTETGFDRTNPRASYQPDRRFTTLGGRLVQPLGDAWSAIGEVALQRGRQSAEGPLPSRPIAAWGGYTRLKRTFPLPTQPCLSLGCIALSGQKPGETTLTAWNPVFSRWPKWGEAFNAAQGPEKGVGYHTNTRLWEVELCVSLHSRLDGRATFYALKALEPLAPTPGPLYSTGQQRGRIWQFRLDARLTPELKGHLLYERYQPGNAYAGRDAGPFFRAELIWKLGG